MGAIGRALTVLLVLALLAGGTAAWFYASDYGVEATVTDKGADDGGRFIVATTVLGGIDVKRYLPLTHWLAVDVGYFVVYHVRSGDLLVYTSEGGTLVYPPGG